MIEICKCGGLYATDQFEAFGGTPCMCGKRQKAGVEQIRVGFVDWLGALVALRRDVDSKIRIHRVAKPKEKQGLMTMRARKNGIQACINELTRRSRA